MFECMMEMFVFLFMLLIESIGLDILPLVFFVNFSLILFPLIEMNLISEMIG